MAVINRYRQPRKWRLVDFSGNSPAVTYVTADTQILTTKRQILKVAVFGVSAVVSAVFLGMPAKLGFICPRICANFGVSASGSGAPNIFTLYCSPEDNEAAS
jgi:hypothetical protein